MKTNEIDGASADRVFVGGDLREKGHLKYKDTIKMGPQKSG
jgi:hypothetical protein